MEIEALKKLLTWRKSRKIFVIVAVDLLLILFSILVAKVLVTQSFSLSENSKYYLLIFCSVLSYPFLRFFKVYRTVIRFLTAKIAWAILRACVLSGVIWVPIIHYSAVVSGGGQVISTAIVAVFISSALLVGVRYLVRHLTNEGNGNYKPGRRTGIFGVSAQAISLARGMKKHNDYFPVCFFDDTRTIENSEAEGLPILSANDLAKAIEEKNLEGIVIVSDNLSFDDRKALLERLLHMPVSVQILPSFQQSLNDMSEQEMLRNVRFEDLMNRKAKHSKFNLLQSHVVGKTILITGGAGSIGTALCKEITNLTPEKLIVLDFSESELVRLKRCLENTEFKNVEFILGSIEDERLLRSIFKENSVDIVYHAAAYKHVDILEDNILQGVRNNVVGTVLVGRLAAEYKVSNFVLISSDKAVEPSGIMGATKRWCELIVASYRKENGNSTKFCAVRFGNVFYSSGSVIPLFQQQISQGGPVTITDPRMTRYFMSVNEAAELIVQASAFGKMGEIMFLDMGEPVSVLQLAKSLIRLAGKTIKNGDQQNGQIEIVELGARSGEKIHEKLYFDHETLVDTEHENIKICKSNEIDFDVFEAKLAELETALEQGDETAIKSLVLSI